MSENDQSASGNVPEYSVSEISGAIKRILEGSFGRVRVRGEITELKRYPSGHVYLSLKDQGGKISGVIWRGSVSRLGIVPENGIEVIATGRVSAYGDRSSYQLVIDQMSFAGEGALLAKIEKLRQKLLAEGLFDPERKKKIPFLPELIGLVTSSRGAVLHDILTTLSRRFPRSVLVWPVAVQGEGAADQIASAIAGFSTLPQRPDLLIVARGGGSLEDLMAFNEENVLRAVAACPIPLISAVGHETDTTLIDYVSDQRAPTPTAAAEMAVPLRSEMIADLAHRGARLAGGLSRHLQLARAHTEQVTARLPDLPSLLDTARFRLDERGQRLELALPMVASRARQKLMGLEARMPSAAHFLGQKQAGLGLASAALAAGIRHRMQQERAGFVHARLGTETLIARIGLDRARLTGIAGRLEAVSPEAVLARGYALVQDARGKPVTTASGRPRGGAITLRFADGTRQGRLDPLGTEKEEQGDLGL
ncbi:exodeoxyribonuclease VII large subunit [Asaia siamensis]|uniref:Exodeoxyribonuclease 7 large subunit n=1 Tax=Asaia siamensis TaxID=110479 RepID=A0ABQ1LTL4_9PROT|nr:exodeoxyribonuclease VII large subunit [Asaia siamensis]GBR04099.1 exodeoxyribonuclease VII large subunit [Asaia siamensis NRIC 0323]GGC28914.1 exodeoxyribonuclease 7 large subunit [Asaia siamensis]